VAEHFNEPVIETNDLEQIFSHLVNRLKNKKFIVVLDEFSYLVEKDSAIPSIFQVIVDGLLGQTNVFLILCGSSVSMMEIGVLSKKSALYGRKTAHIELGQLDLRAFHDFFPNNNIERNIEFYSVLGGVPFYLEKFSDEQNTFKNIKEQIFSKSGRLYEEIDFLLREELREPDVYKGILSAIASGQTKVVEIANKTGIKASDMDKYLKVLIRLGFVKKEIPVTSLKSKKSIYRIDDNFFSFSFTFSEPFKSNLELGEITAVEERLKRDFNRYLGKKFEKLVREQILIRTGIIRAQRLGSWWGHYRDEKTRQRKAIEIDIVGINDTTKEILFGECKWKTDVDGKKLVQILKEKATHVLWPDEKKVRKEYYVIFAKSFKNVPNDKNIHCIQLSHEVFQY
jgi:AAA+ ATPase superfamily predicted ATPase